MNDTPLHLDKNYANCPFCAAPNAIRTKLQTQHFTYGAGDDAVLLKASVPVRFCCSCGFEYTDAAGEDAREDAVQNYLQHLEDERLLRSMEKMEDRIREETEGVPQVIEDAKAPF